MNKRELNTVIDELTRELKWAEAARLLWEGEYWALAAKRKPAPAHLPSVAEAMEKAFVEEERKEALRVRDAMIVELECQVDDLGTKLEKMTVRAENGEASEGICRREGLQWRDRFYEMTADWETECAAHADTIDELEASRFQGSETMAWGNRSARELAEYRAVAHERLNDEKNLTTSLCSLVGRWRDRCGAAVAARAEAQSRCEYLEGALDGLVEERDAESAAADSWQETATARGVRLIDAERERDAARDCVRRTEELWGECELSRLSLSAVAEEAVEGRRDAEDSLRVLKERFGWLQGVLEVNGYVVVDDDVGGCSGWFDEQCVAEFGGTE